jgi:hypothetical protein
LEEIKARFLVKNSLKTPFNALLVYDANMQDLSTLWTFHRRLVYSGWPVVSADEFLEQNKTDWAAQGVNEIYFIKTTANTLPRPIEEQTIAADVLVDSLGDTPYEIIKRPDGRDAFLVYHFHL